MQIYVSQKLREEATNDTSWPPVEYIQIAPAGDPFTAITTHETHQDGPSNTHYKQVTVRRVQ